MPSAPPPPDRKRYQAVYVSRALFGAGFVALGAVSLARVAMVAAPVNSKLLGGALGVVMIALGLVRIGQYLRWRRGTA